MVKREADPPALVRPVRDDEDLLNDEAGSGPDEGSGEAPSTGRPGLTSRK